MLVATIIFSVSLVLVIALFALKYYELKRGTRIAEATREKADHAARDFKFVLVQSRRQLEKLPPEVAHHSLRVAAAGALSAASLAQAFERQAYRFADFISSKRGFQRRETKSEFLKQVTDFRKEGVDESENL